MFHEAVPVEWTTGSSEVNPHSKISRHSVSLTCVESRPVVNAVGHVRVFLNIEEIADAQKQGNMVCESLFDGQIAPCIASCNSIRQTSPRKRAVELTLIKDRHACREIADVDTESDVPKELGLPFKFL